MIIPKKVNILEEMLTGTDEEAFAGLTELSDFLARQEKPTPQEARSGKPRRKKAGPKKKKVTHYLSPEISEGLDRILPRIRKIVPEEKGRRISKSRVVDTSLRLLLREFEEKEKESLLVRQFLPPEDRDRNGS